MVARKSNITSQGASASASERSRKNHFGIEFSILRIVHGAQNCEVTERHGNHEKYMEFLFETTISCHGRASRMSGGKYMACSDTSNTLYNTTLGKSCTTLLQKLICARVTSWVVFRRLLAIQPVDFNGGAKIKYYKSMRIREYQRGVQEKIIWA